MKKQKKPWPTKDVMNQIYDLKLWGGKTSDFYSGTGSHDPKIVKPYLNAVVAFLKSQNNSLKVLDLGCGDFNIGKQLVAHTKTYIAVDIVDTLIERNKKLFRHDNLKFQCLDISKDVFPEADCIILRQVLQHLSNTEITAITKKLISYKYIILTEHLPVGVFIPNKDIISGQGVRLKQQSGVDVLKAPFNLTVKEKEILEEHTLADNKGRILTTLYQVF